MTAKTASNGTAPKLTIRHLNKSFGVGAGQIEVLRDIDLDLADNEFVSIVGTSGCGKSTLLSIVAGLEAFDDRTSTKTYAPIKVDGEPVFGPGLDRGVVFQSYTLLPWLTVRKNIEFALQAAGYDAAERRRFYDALNRPEAPTDTSPSSNSRASPNPIQANYRAA